MAAAASDLLKRQSGTNGGYDSYDSIWWSSQWMAVRYTIVALIFVALITFFIGGYYHARRRLRAGLEPLPYHSFMVRRRYRNAYPPPPHGPAHEGYPMHDRYAYPAPPPPYQPPPVYQPPSGAANKVLIEQHVSETNRTQGAQIDESGIASPSASRQPGQN